MTTLRDLVEKHTGLDPKDVDHLHRLAGDWQLVADLAFADLLLWVPIESSPGRFICVAQVRPATAPTAYQADEVGRVADGPDVKHLVAAMTERRIWREGDPAWLGDVPARREAIAVCRAASEPAIAVLGRDTNLSTARTPSQLELNYLAAADDLAQMIVDGSFPPPRDPSGGSSIPRVGDGLIRLDAGGSLSYASPNAQSAFRRLGLTSSILGEDLAAVTARLAGDPPDGGKASARITAALRGQAARWRVQAGGTEVLLRTVPLTSGGVPNGALVLARDMTESADDIESDTGSAADVDGPGSGGFDAGDPTTVPHAGYSADTVDADDRLGIDRDVAALAALVASNRTRPPLSIGLFGDWGSGKSFFMRRLQARVAMLADATREAGARTPPETSYFHQHVVQVTFNAWHYVDANLWASLVTRVFECLGEHVQRLEREPGAAYRNLLTELETSQALLAHTRRRRDLARAALRRAEERRQRERDRSSSRTLADLTEDHPELSDPVRLLTDTLGLEEGATDLTEVREVSRDLRGIRGRLRRRWTALHRHPGRGWNRRRLLGVLAGLAVATGCGLVVLLQFNQPLAALVTSAAALLTGVTTSLKVLLADTRDALRAAERVLAVEDKEEAASLRAAEQEVDAARERVRSVEDELAGLRELEPSNLYRFINDRYTSSDYRQHLGVVALIQRDLETLSNLLAPPGRPGAGEQPSARLPDIDRIVLYIDDLDRCPPHKVVQVLQAVHLLLAFPLFVVIVGVDSRWLVRSLEHEYEAILSPSSLTSGAAPGELDQLASTPQNYLEKIFQVPFWLRPMQPPGFRQLVRSLLVESVPADNRPAGSRPADDRPAGSSPPAPPDEATTETDLPAPPDPATDDVDPVVDRSAERTPPGSAGRPDLTPPMLQITAREASFLETLAPLIPTPRAAKRLINLYRLLKSGVSTDQLPAFHGANGAPAEHEAALLLLAILVGMPAHAQAVFQCLRTTAAGTWGAFVAELRDRPARALDGRPATPDATWHRLGQLLTDIAPASAADLTVFRRWVDDIARYSFDAGPAPQGYHIVTDIDVPGRRGSSQA